MNRSVDRIVCVLGSAFVGLTSLVGCVPFFYAYPSVSRVPQVTLDAPCQDVHAFRVDVQDEQNCVEYGETDRYLLSRVQILGGRVPGQTKAGLAHGRGWNCIALIFHRHTEPAVLLRLYRPGYRLVEIRSNEPEVSVNWEPAAGAATREAAIDALLSSRSTRTYPPPRDTPHPEFHGLAPGSASKQHRQVLLFAAAEYQRLADFLVVNRQELAELTDRLRQKAAWLQKLAQD